MGDEALRALERDARARPDDRAAAWAYARGLERAGERRALWLELCLLARAGDHDASRAVDGWVPGLGGTTTPVLASLRAPKVERVSLVRDEAFRNDVVQDVVLAPDGSVLLLAGERLVAIDPPTERIGWVQEGVAALQACGDDALILMRERSAFLRRAGGTELHAGAGLIGSGLVDSGVAWGDRLVVQSTVSPGQLAAFDVGDAFGRLIWKQAAWGTPALAGDVLLNVVEDGIEARELESGRTLWERLSTEDGGLQHSWCDHDRAGVVFQTWLERAARTTALDPRSGAERWSVRHERSEGPVALTPALVVAGRGDQHLDAYSRDDGRVAWTADVPPIDMVVAYATGPDALYVASAIGRALRLMVLDLANGAVRATAEARLPAEAANGSAWPMWIRDGSVEVLVTSPSDLAVIVRFAD